MESRVQNLGLFFIILFCFFLRSESYSQLSIDTACLWIEYEFWPEKDSQVVRLESSGLIDLEDITHIIRWDPSKLSNPEVVEVIERPNMVGGFVFDEVVGWMRLVWSCGRGNCNDIEPCKSIYTIAFHNSLDTIVPIAPIDTSTSIHFSRPLGRHGAYTIVEENCCLTSNVEEGEGADEIQVRSPLSSLAEVEIYPDFDELEVFDMSGRLICAIAKENLNNYEIKSGLYVLRVFKNNNLLGCTKIIIL